MTPQQHIRSSNFMDATEISSVGHLVARKLAAYWGQGGLLERTPANVLSLYGMIRLTDCGGTYDAYVDREMAAFLFAGDMPVGELPCLGIGGMAGAFRLVQGYYLTSRHGRERLQETVKALLHQQDREGGFFHSPSPSGEGVRVETLLVVCPFFAMAGIVLRDEALFTRAIETFLAGEARLLDPDTGLFHHAAHWTEPGQRTPDAWARGNGCAVAALAETLRYLPECHPEREVLIGRLTELLKRLLPLQAPSGLWRQQLTDPEAPEESSGSALIAAGLAVALRQGWLPEEHLPAALSAWEGIASCVEDGGCGNLFRVAVDTEPGESAAYYRDRPQALNDLNGFGPIMLAAATYYELARVRTWKSRYSPVHSFDPPPGEEVEEGFSRAHELCEARYNGDGSWGQGNMDLPEDWTGKFNSESRGSHPLLRDSGYCAIGYLGAHRHRSNPLYLQRAREALDYLVKKQEPDGSFRLYTRRREGQVNHNGCLYVSGIAGAALVKGYEEFGEEKYLRASAKLARWEIGWPVVRNVNFNSFAIWHLAEHHRLTGQAEALEAALQKVKWRLMTRQQVTGGWRGHDSWIWYHAFILRAYAALDKVLPPEHPLRHDLEPATLAAVDYYARLQQEDGALFANPETPRPRAADYGIAALSLLASTREDATLRHVLNGTVRYRLAPTSGNMDDSYNDERNIAFKGNKGCIVVYGLGSYLDIS